MSPIVERCLDTICLERDEGYDASFDVVTDLVNEYGEADLAQRLFDEIPRHVPFEVVCDLFSILLWQTSDNGSAIMRTVEDWLRQANDTRKMLVALNLELIPFSSAAEAKEVLGRIPGNCTSARHHAKRVLEYWSKHGT